MFSMEPRRLLAKLMEKSNDSPTTLAKKLDNRTTQPQIYKFVNGMVREPRAHTLAPIADHYGIPLEALINQDVAAKVMQERFGIDPEKVEMEAVRKIEERRTSSVEVVKPVRLKQMVNNREDVREYGMSWNRYADGVVGKEIIESLRWPYTVERNNSVRKSAPDFLILNENNSIVFGIEIFEANQMNGRIVSKSEIDRIYGFLWRMKHEVSYLGHYPIGAVILVKDVEYDEGSQPPELAAEELMMSLRLAMRHDLLAAATVVGINTSIYTEDDGAQFERTVMTKFPAQIGADFFYPDVQTLTKMMVERHSIK